MTIKLTPTDFLDRWRWRHRRSAVAVALAVAGLLAATMLPAAAQQDSAEDEEQDEYISLAVPAPPAVADYFPFAYDTETTMSSAVLDTTASTVTMPLHRGEMRNGRTVWYVMTDTSDRTLARELGLNWSPKLANTPRRAMRTGAMADDGSFVFDRGTVDFSPARVVTPGEAPDYFPPVQAEAGSVGDRWYSPLVSIRNADDAVFNATMVAFDVDADEIEFPDGDIDYTKVIDRAVAISPADGTVTFSMNVGVGTGRPVLFLSLDSNDVTVSALEATTYAPALSNIPVGLNDSPDSAVAANYIIVNGPTGADNPQRQGLNSALSDPGAQVLDIFDGAPDLINGEAYSPMWDLYVAEWTPAAIKNGYRSVLHSELQVVGLAERGWLTGPSGSAFGASGLISNCPLLGHL